MVDPEKLGWIEDSRQTSKMLKGFCNLFGIF